MENLKEFEGKETAQLVDRYKFLDLYPCTHTELRSIGYNEVCGVMTGNASRVPQPQEETETQTVIPRYTTKRNIISSQKYLYLNIF